MPWTAQEKQKKFLELQCFYVKEGKTIRQVGKILGIHEQTVFRRLKYFNIPSNPAFKKRQDVIIPHRYTSELAEFFGIMLGDGKLSPNQVLVTLGKKEVEYIYYVVGLIEKIFQARPKICITKTGNRIIYLGSVDLTRWLVGEGLVYNKVAAQVDVPAWIFEKKEFMKRFTGGFFDTDGSVYKLRWGMQISFTNRSLPLLHSIRKMLVYLGYSTSNVSGYALYITKKKDVSKFFGEIKPKNLKHRLRFHSFLPQTGR